MFRALCKCCTSLLFKACKIYSYACVCLCVCLCVCDAHTAREVSPVLCSGTMHAVCVYLCVYDARRARKLSAVPCLGSVQAVCVYACVCACMCLCTCPSVFCFNHAALLILLEQSHRIIMLQIISASSISIHWFVVLIMY